MVKGLFCIKWLLLVFNKGQLSMLYRKAALYHKQAKGKACGRGGDMVFEDVYCSFRPSLIETALWLHCCSQHQQGPKIVLRIFWCLHRQPCWILLFNEGHIYLVTTSYFTILSFIRGCKCVAYSDLKVSCSLSDSDYTFLRYIQVYSLLVEIIRAGFITYF